MTPQWLLNGIINYISLNIISINNLPCNVKSVTHQYSSWRHFIFLSPTDIPPRISWIMAFNWHHSSNSVNFQNRTNFWMAYPLSTKTRTWLSVKPRIPWIVPLKIFTGTHSAAIVTFTTVDTYGASVGGFLYTPAESAPIADITCKINKCKQS